MKSQTGSEAISPCHRALWRWECPSAGTVQPFCLPPRATRTLPSSRGGGHSHAHQPPPQDPCRPGVPSLESRGLGSRPLRHIVVRTEVTCPHLPCFPVTVGEERAKAQAGDSSVPPPWPASPGFWTHSALPREQEPGDVHLNSLTLQSEHNVFTRVTHYSSEN